MESIKKVSYGTSIVQKLRRVSLDANLLATLDLKVGDLVEIELDVASATIMIRKLPEIRKRVNSTSGGKRRA